MGAQSTGAGALTALVLLGCGGEPEPLPPREIVSIAEPEGWTPVAPALDVYVDGERRRGIALMATGGALLGLGVAAVIVGSVRLVRHRRGSGQAGPVSLHPGRPGALAF